MGNQQSGAGERGGGKKGGEKGEKKKYEPPVPTRVSRTVQPATYGLKILKLAAKLIHEYFFLRLARSERGQRVLTLPANCRP